MDRKIIHKIFTVVLVFVFTFSLCGCAALNFRHEYDKGMRFYNEKKYDEAIVSFNNALTYKPDSYSALCLLGTSYAYKKDEKMAEKTFQDAINLFPDEWNAYVFLADLKRSRHDYDLAIEYYETAISLPSMGGKEKTYYKKLLKEIKSEQSGYNLKYSDALKQAKAQDNEGIVNTYTEKNKKTEDVKQTGEIVLNIDTSKWVKSIDQKDEKSRLVTYGLKGENAQEYKWTKLITLQYFVLSDNFKTTLDNYFNTHIGAIEAIAKNSNKPFEKKIIVQRKNDILYEWKFDNSKETEISRIIYTPQGLYHIHCAKKGAFSDEEKVKAIDLLKTAVLK